MTDHQHVTAIVCRSHDQFRAWCYDNDRDPRDPLLRPVLNEQHARGRWFDDVIWLGGPASLITVAESRLRSNMNA